MIYIARDAVAIVDHYDRYREDELNAGYISMGDWLASCHHGVYDYENSRIGFEREEDALAFKFKFGI